MSFILRALGLQWPQLSSGDERAWSSWAPVTKSGARVNADTAMTYSAWWSGVTFVAVTTGMLPLQLFGRRTNGDGDVVGRFRARRNPVDELLTIRPNRWQTPYQWKSMMQGHVETRGNGYSRILPGVLGPVSELQPLHPDRMRVELNDDDELLYIYTHRDGREETLLADEVFHLRGFSSDGYVGLSPVAHARETIGVGMSMEEHGARLFSQGTVLSGWLSRDGPPLSDEATKRLRADWQALYGGSSNAYKVALLEEGMEFHQLGMTSEDAQFLESRKFQISDVARFLRLPPHILGDLERATFSNIEHQGLELVTYSLMPRFVNWEQEINLKLLLRPDAYYAKFNVDALLRGDTKSRFDAYAIAITNAIMNPNEVREKEDMDPYDGGDQYLQPLNMAPVGSDQFGIEAQEQAWRDILAEISGKNGHHGD